MLSVPYNSIGLAPSLYGLLAAAFVVEIELTRSPHFLGQSLLARARCLSGRLCHDHVHRLSHSQRCLSSRDMRPSSGPSPRSSGYGATDANATALPSLTAIGGWVVIVTVQMRDLPVRIIDNCHEHRLVEFAY